jgi:hypothetical protein
MTVYEDVILWWALSRLRSLVPVLDNSSKELFSKLEKIFRVIGPHDPNCVPAIDILYRNTANVASWIVDWRLSNQDNVDSVLKALMEAEDTINIGTLDFTRRIERVRELVSHGLRKTKKYEISRSHALSGDTQRVG